jgi:hypothetical protein
MYKDYLLRDIPQQVQVSIKSLLSLSMYKDFNLVDVYSVRQGPGKIAFISHKYTPAFRYQPPIATK